MKVLLFMMLSEKDYEAARECILIQVVEPR